MPTTKVKRRFEFIAGRIDKYWELELLGKEVLVRFGRNGTHGQTTRKTFSDEAGAREHVNKMIAAEIAKGYSEVGCSGYPSEPETEETIMNARQKLNIAHLNGSLIIAMIAGVAWQSLVGGLPPIDVPLKRILNGGTEAEFFRLAKLGDVVSAQSRYTDISEREGRSGPMVLLKVETTYTNQDDETLLVSTMTVIIR